MTPLPNSIEQELIWKLVSHHALENPELDSGVIALQSTSRFHVKLLSNHPVWKEIYQRICFGTLVCFETRSEFVSFREQYKSTINNQWRFTHFQSEFHDFLLTININRIDSYCLRDRVRLIAYVVGLNNRSIKKHGITAFLSSRINLIKMREEIIYQGKINTDKKSINKLLKEKNCRNFFLRLKKVVDKYLKENTHFHINDDEYQKFKEIEFNPLNYQILINLCNRINIITT